MPAGHNCGDSNMSLDGVWVLEIVGIYGWERISTVFMEKGRYLSGSAFSFSQGSYVVDGKKIRIKLHVTQHGETRTIFGEKRKHFSIVMKAKCKENKIKGQIFLKGAKSTDDPYSFRLLRQADLAALPG
jgi:hypothetical protein